VRRGALLFGLVALASLPAGPAASGPGGGHSTATPGADPELPIPIPERPFMLLEAPRRHTPSEPARVHVQLRHGGRVKLAVFRVNDPAPLVAAGLTGRQGVAVASNEMGQEAERLLTAPGRLPRKGKLLTLVRLRAAKVDNVRRARRLGWQEETEAYDSYSAEEEVATTWVRRELWGKSRPSLGRLPAGLYLVRALRGSWATAAYLSVGRLTLLVRRGDVHDQVLVTDPDGRPQSGVTVEALLGTRRISSARTDASGGARLKASDHPTLRFVARRGADIAWSDVTHARLSECDPLVYLATGRPVYRDGETIYLRGHVRGCTTTNNRAGGFSPLANEPVVVSPQEPDDPPTLRTDRDGNFTAKLTAGLGDIKVRVRGKEHSRDVQIDRRQLPKHRLNVRLDRSWAASGQTVGVTVADDKGGWPRPREVTLRSPAGMQRGRIAPGKPARFTFRLPAGLPTLKAAEVSATVEGGYRITTATAQLWIGARAEVVHLHADRAQARRGQQLPVRVTAANLGGAPVSGPVQLTLRGTDGNRPKGAARWRGELNLGSGNAAGLVPLRGAGPWWIEARRGAASASLTVWASAKPPPLSSRGPLAVQPLTRVAAPGAPLLLDLRLPPGAGRAWVTLEQGSVWSSTLVQRRGHRTVRARLPVPPRARGLASVVVSHIARGQVRTATATVEVATSRALDLQLSTDRRTYAEGAKTRVTLQARGVDGTARDAVVSLWLADAGYWELGQDRYPSPTDFFALPGRMSSAGDSTAPVAFGAEEGRHLDAALRWNGKPLNRSTFRHGWGHGGELVTLSAQGSLSQVATRLARAAGLAGARVCRSAERAVGRVELLARALPWDLVTLHVAEQTETQARVERRILHLSCGGSGSGGAGHMGSRRGSAPRVLAGMAGHRSIREQQLEGTLRFIGLRRLGPDGRLTLDLRLPRHPGRWRIEALAIADDGGGDRAHATVHTVRPLHASVELPAQLSPGDLAHGELHLRGAAALHGKRVALKLTLPPAVELLGSLPQQVTLDRAGRASIPLRLRAKRAGSGAVVLKASSGKASDRVWRPLRVRQPRATRPVDLRAVVGPAAARVALDLPPLARPSRLTVSIDDDPLREIQATLQRLRRPRWNLPSLTLDRLAALRALEHALAASVRADRPAYHSPRFARLVSLRAELRRTIEGELAALEQLKSVDGAISWWTTLRSDTGLTARVLLQVQRRRGVWSNARATVIRRAKGWLAAGAREPRSARTLGPTAALLAGGGHNDRELARKLLQKHDALLRRGRVRLDGATWALRAARRLRDAGVLRNAKLEQRLSALIVRDVEAALSRPASGGCGGPIWFLCLRRGSVQAEVARAASALLQLQRPGARKLAARVAAWIDRRPVDPWWTWGSADADVLELMSRLRTRSSATAARATRFEVLIDGRRVASGSATSPAKVSVTQAGKLQVRLSAAPGRACRLRIAGNLAALPPKKEVGPAKLRLELVRGKRDWRAVVTFHLAKDARAVQAGIPLPAGLQLPGDPTSRQSTEVDATQPWRGWIDVGEPKVTTRPRLWVEQGELRLRWPRLRAGWHVVKIRLSELAPGSYGAAGAWLRTADARVWALTPSTRVTIHP
jgi:hypothetical protein